MRILDSGSVSDKSVNQALHKQTGSKVMVAVRIKRTLVALVFRIVQLHDRRSLYRLAPLEKENLGQPRSLGGTRQEE